MLARPYRLTKTDDFDKVAKKGKLYQSASFGMTVLKRSDSKYSRFGIVVSKKISKDAVQRNRAKRAIREAIRQSLVYTKGGYDVVFLAKPMINRKYTDELMREVSQVMQKAGVLK